ncbi:MAG: hypothetical protein JSR17_02105 [Proteobacteria bacterium]|nr:hypothetical protein [Pseudomonadota bacterium]
MTAKKRVLILGDSTIDNRIWLGLEKFHLFVGHYPFLSKCIDFITWLNPFKPKSVIENLRAQMPNAHIIDRTNDGFTTQDVLQGAYRDKVFGFGAHRFFPHEYFKPLDTSEINNADQIVISIGGNNFREFIQAALGIRNKDQREKYITQEYAKVFQNLVNDYKTILKEIAAKNSHAEIVLMTQYYPALKQKTLLGTSIYDFMEELGRIRHSGTAQDTIVDVMKDAYNEVISFAATDPNLRRASISVIDVSSSLNPNFSNNYVGQIEPSDTGGKYIAQMLAYMLAKNKENTKRIYRFLPEFFTHGQLDSKVLTCDLKPDFTYSPVHPEQMTKPRNFSRYLLSAMGFFALAGAALFLEVGGLGISLVGIAGSALGHWTANFFNVGQERANPHYYQFKKNNKNTSVQSKREEASAKPVLSKYASKKPVTSQAKRDNPQLSVSSKRRAYI